MTHIFRIAVFALLMVPLRAPQAAQSGVSGADVLITAFRDKQWQVRYELTEPTKELAFARSPDESCQQAWLADQLFEIVSTPRGEVVRRKDGSEFKTVRIRLSARYRSIPNDYAPFSPFGDGGVLFYTGQFFACPDSCQSGATWSFSLWADPEDSIVLGGRRESYFAQWSDTGDGRMVYVGKGKGMKTSQFTAIVDTAMPEPVRASLLSDLPAVIKNFADRFSPLNEPITLFASCDAAHQQGSGRQGGVLPNQIFTHFYGARWERAMREPDFAFELSWHFAHEAAHLFQRQRYSTEAGDSWIHEGAAEAFAALELGSGGQAARTAVRDKVERMRMKCAQDLGDQPMSEVFLGRDLSAAYSCGLLLNLYVDAQVRSRNKDGLFAVWREYLRRTAGDSRRDRGVYLDSISLVGGAEIGAGVATLLDKKHPDIEIRH